MPTLYAIDNKMKGDAGVLSQAINPDTGKVESNRPKVGCCMRVGSLTGRTYCPQDYWTTTPVLEILEETESEVKFRTKNSIYIWKA
jgi:hypothetical protein